MSAFVREYAVQVPRVAAEQHLETHDAHERYASEGSVTGAALVLECLRTVQVRQGHLRRRRLTHDARSQAFLFLPAGLIASSTIGAAQSPHAVIDAMLIGVDLGPNLPVTGSLATILWLAAIRREG